MASYINNLWPNFFPAGGAGLPRVGPFQNGDNLYLFFRYATGGNRYITAWKSTDSGATWAEIDGANRPRVDQQYYECVQNGATVHVILNSYDVPAPPWERLGVINFDMAADSWGASPGTWGPACYVAFYGSSLAAARRSDDSLVIAYQDYGAAPDWDYRVRVVDWSVAAGWGIPQTVMSSAVNNMYLLDGVLGSDDRFHIFGQLYSVLDTYHRSLSSAGILGTQQTILNSISAYSFSIRALRSGSTIYLPYVPDTDDSLRVIFGASETDPTWDTEQVTPNMPCIVQEENSVGGMLIGGVPYLLWCKATGGDPRLPDGLYYSKRSGGPWDDGLLDTTAYMPMPSSAVSGAYLFWSDTLSPAGWYYDTLAPALARYRVLP